MELEVNKNNKVKKPKVSKAKKVKNSVSNINNNGKKKKVSKAKVKKDNEKINNKVKKTKTTKKKVSNENIINGVKNNKVKKPKAKVTKAKAKKNNKVSINKSEENVVNIKINNKVVSVNKVSINKNNNTNKENKVKKPKASKGKKAVVPVIVETINEQINVVKNIIENKSKNEKKMKSTKKINNNKKQLEIKNKVNKHLKNINNIIKANSSSKSAQLLKYLLTIGYPKQKYFAYQSYEGTEFINKKPVSNFTRKYKKKFVYDHEDKDIICDEKCMQLFDKSYDYMSQIQSNLLKRNITNYIAGGAGLKLYSLASDVKNTENVYLTKDYDLYLYYENSDKDKITNTTIINNISNITDSILEISGTPKYSFLELYIILNYTDNKDFYEMFKILFDNDYELYSYMSFVENDTYIFKFLKLIGEEFCLRLKIKFLKIDELLKEKIYSYTKVTFYKINRTPNGQFSVENVYIPLEILIKNKNDCNLELMKGEVTVNNNKYFVYNENTLLYNLLHMYYKYNHNTGNTKIPLKKQQGKDIRDEKRLNLFFTIYCKLLYPKLKQKDIDDLLVKLKAKSVEFKDNIESIKNFKVIEDVFKK
jgi:hypothetical protein